VNYGAAKPVPGPAGERTFRLYGGFAAAARVRDIRAAAGAKLAGCCGPMIRW